MEKYKKLSKLDLLKSNFFGILSFILIITGGTYAATNLTGDNIFTVNQVNSGDMVSASAFEKIRMGAEYGYSKLEEMGCSQTISVGGLEVCASNSYRNAQWFYNNDKSGNIAAGKGGLYDRNTAIKTDGTGPCGYGFRLPTNAEWGTIYTALSSNYSKLRSILGLTTGGRRHRSDGSFAWPNFGCYWSSTSHRSWSSDQACIASIDSGRAWLDDTTTGMGWSVRCIKD